VRNKTIGVLRDFTSEERPGGAQIASDRFIAGAPENIQVVLCPPGQLNLDCDAYLSFLVKLYTDEELEFLSGHSRHFRFETDWWEPVEQQSKWRNTLVENSIMTFYWSPLHEERSKRIYGVQPKHSEAIPCPMDPNVYRECRAIAEKRPGSVLWAGEWHPRKGNDIMVRWAARNETRVDAYGMRTPEGEIGPYVTGKGFAPAADWLHIMASYEKFVHFPRVPDAFNMTLMEAYLLGLEVIYTNDIGCLSYDKPPEELIEDCAVAPATLWSRVGEVL